MRNTTVGPKSLSLGLLLSALAFPQVITTVAGTTFTFPSQPLPAVQAPLSSGLTAAAVDRQGNLYIADAGNNVVVRVTTDGTLSIVAGNGIAGFSGDGGPATNAALSGPAGLAVNSAGDIFVSDNGNFRIRKISNGVITTIAGNGRRGISGDGGPATMAELNAPSALALDPAGNLFMVDNVARTIREISGGTITTVVGGSLSGLPAPQFGYLPGFAPNGIAFDTKGNLYISTDALVYEVSGQAIALIAGNDQPYSGDGGPATAAGMYPHAIAVDAQSNIYIADASGDRIRKISQGIVTTIAGNGTVGFSGDGGPAIAATLDIVSNPVGMTVDTNGNICFADSGRIRKISGGTISTVAGDGDYQYTGDGGAAVSAAIRASSIATDSQGSIYFADGSYRIRKISNGVITSIAGNGSAAYSGDGGPAIAAGIGSVTGIKVDSSGHIFFGEGARVREISNGIVTTLAGNGISGLAGDGGLATNAEIGVVTGIAIDDDGDIFIEDSTNGRIRKVSGQIITTVAGSIPCGSIPGCNAGSGDGGSASNAILNLLFNDAIATDKSGNLYVFDATTVSTNAYPTGTIREVTNGIINTVAGGGRDVGEGVSATSAFIGNPTGFVIDSSGNFYYSDRDTNRVREISNGVVNTIAGGLTNTGDGELAVFAQLQPGGIALDPAGNLFVVDGGSRIRAILAVPPLLQLSPSSINLAAASGGAPVSASFTISATSSTSSWVTVPGMPYTIQMTGVYAWLSISPQSGNTPGLITVTADPSNLSPGSYPAAFNLIVPNANPPEVLMSLQFTVTAAVPATIAVDHNHLSFTYSSTSTARTQTITVSNAGGGPLPFTVSIVPNAGQSASWLSLTPGSATATPASPAVLTVQADPTNLAPGTYSANIVINSAAGSATVSVTMTISTNPLIMLLSQTGLTFIAVQNGGAVPPQTFSVLNLGSGTLNWTAQTSVLGNVSNWLVATPDSGTSGIAASSTAPVVMVSVNPGGLAPGVYYGLVTVSSVGASNTPQGVVAVLQVLPAGTDTAPVVQPTSLIFTAATGDSSPGSLNVQVYDPTGTGKSFRSGIVTANGGTWLATLPTDATVPPGGPVQVVVQPIVNNLTPGTYAGTLTLQFSDGRVNTVGTQFVVTGGGAATDSVRAVRPAQASGPCVSNQLMPSLLTLGSGFTVPAGYPWGLEAQVVDNCGAPQVDGTVFVQFSNGDAPVKLQSLGNGVWDGTWPVGSTPAAVTLTVLAQNAASVKGQSVLDGGLAAAMPSPIIPNNGVVSTASFAAGQPVAPGELISIFGQQLSGGQAPAGAGNLPTVLAGTTVAVGSQSGPSAGTFQALPLYYASTGLVNAVIPYETSVNTNQQILLQWGTTYAPAVYVDVAAAAPGIFAVADVSGNVIGPGNPAHTGQVVVIYCTGLGAVNPAVRDGAVTPDSPISYALNPVTVIIGSQVVSPPAFAGLTPGVAGLYQINVAVPPGITPGDSVSVSIVVSGQPSAQVLTSVQ